MSDTDKDKIIALLRAEVKAWRKGGIARQPDDEICEAIAATDAAGALEDK